MNMTRKCDRWQLLQWQLKALAPSTILASVQHYYSYRLDQRMDLCMQCWLCILTHWELAFNFWNNSLNLAIKFILIKCLWMLFAITHHRDTANDCSISLHTALFPVGSPLLLCPVLGRVSALVFMHRAWFFCCCRKTSHCSGCHCSSLSTAGDWRRVLQGADVQGMEQGWLLYSSAFLFCCPSPEALSCSLIGLNRAPGCLLNWKDRSNSQRV